MSHKGLATKKIYIKKYRNSQNCSTCNVLGAVCLLITHKYVISAIYHGTTKLHLDGETAETARKKSPHVSFPHISQASRQQRPFRNLLVLNYLKCEGTNIFRTSGSWDSDFFLEYKLITIVRILFDRTLLVFQALSFSNPNLGSSATSTEKCCPHS